jgi:hypothetical protein
MDKVIGLDHVRAELVIVKTPDGSGKLEPPRSTDLFDERPRGGLFARTLAKLPLVGVVGWVARRARSHP